MADPLSNTGVRRRRIVAIALVVTFAAAVAVLTSRGFGDGAPAPSPSARTEGPRLYLAGDGEVWMVNLDGHVKHLRTPQLGPGDPPHRIVARGPRLVAWGYETYSVDPKLKRPPSVLVDDSFFFLPSANRNRVWVAIPDDEREDEGIVATVHEITSGGKRTSRDVRPPGGRWPEAAVDDGLLFHRKGDVVVWDPVKRRVVHRLAGGDLGPTHGNRLASCDFGCRKLRLVNVASGRTIFVEPPEGFVSFRAWDAAFSRDGRTLGVPVRERGNAGSVSLALVDVDSGVATAVPGTSTEMAYNFVAWDAAGEHVFFTGTDAAGGRTIFVHRIGARDADLLDVDVGSFYDAAAI
ncbi:MAG TPA: hypothetical protein VG318_05985 [Actinomycetota bacterium]|nr:hypothetical protein [Actinomycetota bacterium]